MFVLCLASRQQVDMQIRIQSQSSLTGNNQSIGIYDEIRDTPNTENGTEPNYPYDDIRNETTARMQTYDDIPDNDSSSRQPYQSLNTETREAVSLSTRERVAGAPTKPGGIGDAYFIPLVGQQDVNSTSLDTRFGSMLSASDTANLATIVDIQFSENETGEVEQLGYHQLNDKSRFPNPSTTSGNYAVLQRKNSLERWNKLQNNKYSSLLVEVADVNTSDEVTQTTSLTVNKYFTPRPEKQSSHEQGNLLMDSNSAEPDDKQVYRKLDKTTRVLPIEVTRMKYASLIICESKSGGQPDSGILLSSSLIGNEQTTNNVDEMKYHELDSRTMSTSRVDKSEMHYTQLQRDAQSEIFAGKFDCHGLEAATREVGTHEYAAPNVNWNQ
jgi:hypothetical protein